MDKPSFYAMLGPIARQLYAEGSSIFPSVRLAQSWLETGGKIPAWNNLGGYKAGGGAPNGFWKGEVVNKSTWEWMDGRRVDLVAVFRAYDTVGDFYKDQDILYGRSRYLAVRNAATPVEQARMLQASGYASAPDYAATIIAIINADHLTNYDTQVEEGEPMTAEEKQAFDALQAAVKQLTSDNEALKAELAGQNNALLALRQRAAKLEGLHAIADIPAWAKDAIDEAVSANLVDTPKGGSYDFYRIMSVLHRANLL
ncbi:muramidase (flagellum-specific) [Paenibacillus rhizovicinus]|uniref:Muramidase (Flagellum-specific) n=1 Tax=Paenibacillus rhizovicinus TaxID=2704463 RepID=A0A6C0NVD2_9BACL|nr:glucosaminidase domain-containing protein [Paenibacillus rhizovicinus]QHW30137.1 muramidase (flagellum-specific) [Paenibacillus rhizovicinus]